MRNKFFTTAATTIFLSALLSNAGATILFEEDFQTGVLSSTNWNYSESGQVVSDPYDSSNYVLTFSEIHWFGDTFSSLIANTGADTYTLSYDYLTTDQRAIRNGGGFTGLDADGEKPWDPIASLFGPQYHSVYFQALADDWMNVSVTFSLPDSWTNFSLMFEDFRAPTGDAYFDNIVVSDSNPSPVPEPATMLLFGAGLLGLAGARLKRRE